MTDHEVQKLIDDTAVAILDVPGVIALEPGVRTRAGRTSDSPVVVVTVERKIAPELLSKGENLAELLEAEQVDVVEATPLKALFATPEKFGVDADTLAELEARLGYPFLPEAIGVRPPRLRRAIWDADAYGSGITYRPPPGVALKPLEGKIKIRCHASPDAGWKELGRFLRGAKKELVVGMYELTAPHIGDCLSRDAAKRVKVFKLTMDKKLSIGGKGDLKEFDRTEAEHARMFAKAFGSGFEYAYAKTEGRGKTFQTDYHTKLAVRDREAFWMSSGSWQSSNQPNLDPLGADVGDTRLPKCNREWHVIGEHPGLSETWAKFLEWDLETAQNSAVPDFVPSRKSELTVFVEKRDDDDEFPYEKFFETEEFEFVAGEGSEVIPLLTPDNYIEEMTALIEGASQELLVQNQGLSFLKNEESQDRRFTTFMRVLAEKSQSLDRFRLIHRDPAEFGNSRKDKIEMFRRKGFDVKKIRFQVGCHNKGMIIDSERVLIGSHNLSHAGMTANRDASLIVQNPDIASYFKKIFEHDWNLAGKRGEISDARPRRRMLLAYPGELAPPGMKAFNLWELLDVD